MSKQELTMKEKIRDIIETHDSVGLLDYCIDDMVGELYDLCQPEWISVDDPPNETGHILAYDSLVGVRKVFYHKAGHFHPSMYAQERCGYLTHWREMPEPPE